MVTMLMDYLCARTPHRAGGGVQNGGTFAEGWHNSKLHIGFSGQCNFGRPLAALSQDYRGGGGSRQWVWEGVLLNELCTLTHARTHLYRRSFSVSLPASCSSRRITSDTLSQSGLLLVISLCHTPSSAADTTSGTLRAIGM
jgi:hypothetical protein